MKNNLIKFGIWAVLLFVILRMFGSNSPKNSQIFDITGDKFSTVLTDIEREVPEKDVLQYLNHPEYKKISIETNKGTYLVNPRSGAITSLQAKVNENITDLPVVDSEQAVQLVCRDHKLNFKLVNHSHDQETNAHLVHLEASLPGWKIAQNYKFAHDDYQVTMNVEFIRQSDKAELLRPLVILSQPKNQPKKDEVQGFVNKSNQGNWSLDIFNPVKNAAQGWKLPNSFGLHNKYLINAFFNNQENGTKAKRAYNLVQDNQTYSVIELTNVAQSEDVNLDFYIGPKQLSAFNQQDKFLEQTLSFGILSFVSKALLNLLEKINSVTGNFGWAILLLALLIKLLLFPLFVFCRRKGAIYEKFEREYAYRINDINKKYAHNTVAKMEQINALYAQHGLSQTGKMIMILPVIVQGLLILYPLYRALGSYISLHKAPFIFWIKDLSLHDPYFVLPLVLGIATLLLASLQKNTMDQSKYMKYGMPVGKMLLFSNMPAGLVLYWLGTDCFNIIEEGLYRAFFKPHVASFNPPTQG